jgi:hypothetical protein
MSREVTTSAWIFFASSSGATGGTSSSLYPWGFEHRVVLEVAGLGARSVEEEVHRSGVKERERAVDDLGVNVTEYATSTKAVELEDVHPELRGTLGGERIEVEAEAQLLDRIGRQLRELGRFHGVDSTSRRTNRVSSRTLAVATNAQLDL